MSREVAGNARARHVFVQAPGGRAAHRDLGGDGPVLEVGGAVMKHLPDLPFLDHLLGQTDGGDATVIEPDHVGAARFFDSAGHLARLGQVHGQRLFAEDDLTGCGRRERDLMMSIVGRADVDGVDLCRFDELAPVGLHALPSPATRKRLRFVAAARRYCFEHRLISDIEKLVDPMVGVRMRPSHEAVADEADVKLLGHGTPHVGVRSQKSEVRIKPHRHVRALPLCSLPRARKRHFSTSDS